MCGLQNISNGQLDTIKLKALLHIQKFVEDEGDDFSKSLPRVETGNR